MRSLTDEDLAKAKVELEIVKALRDIGQPFTEPDPTKDETEQLADVIVGNKLLAVASDRVAKLSEMMGVDLDRPVGEQLGELSTLLDGNRRLSGTGRPQFPVANHRKSPRRRRR